MKDTSAGGLDRLSIRERPRGLPLMRQHWGKLLFMHWPVRAELLRPLVPARLTLDTFEGDAWIGLVPFKMWGIRAKVLPPVPALSAFLELNVRTYVHLDGVPGVWFLSCDASHALGVWGARKFYHLPYFNAQMSLRQHETTINFASRRTERDATRAEFRAEWTIGEALPESAPDSLPYFLTERYCLYTAHRDRIYRGRVAHAAWPLRRAELKTLDSTMFESHGLETPAAAPLLHYAEAVAVDIWPLENHG